MTGIDGTSFVSLSRGDLFPWAALRDAPEVTFGYHTTAGRYLVFLFYASAADPAVQEAIGVVYRHRACFDDERGCFFGMGRDASDKAQGRVADTMPGIRFMDDSLGVAARICGALPEGPGPVDAGATSRAFWLVVDPTLHVLANIPLGPEARDHDAVLEMVRDLPAPGAFAGFELPVPVLLLPNVFDRALCRHLVGLYDADGGSESGIYRNGAGVNDHSFKRRRDYTIEDADLIRRLQGMIARRVSPEIERIFFTKITRMERYIVGCYAAEDNAHFRPHRDNGPGLTAHRRYAVSVNLSEDFDGGEVSFPEYSQRGIKAPQGWAVVFPAAILHAVSKVTYGRRYAFLPFVYDEEGAKIRDRELARHHAATAA
ncbi:2OG-Fe(II) oxygenase [Lichenibacterium minor]|uniref:2OG-Fe(II) oxygenase n=1 Tax=Lichenibacterium minor TaxID=2316528 RepID=A0A4Q2U7W9_9HYPH|nr:2OG-Fe(II) oxygenase [Lichenibacterium minor]RYC31221.1 2OG-Fe(II) oxygenase [Lichenibacterium minor]